MNIGGFVRIKNPEEKFPPTHMSLLRVSQRPIANRGGGQRLPSCIMAILRSKRDQKSNRAINQTGGAHSHSKLI